MSNLVSPDQMIRAAKDEMLGGREPTTTEDRVLVINFVAFNIAAGLEEPVCKLLKMIYPEVFEGVSERDVEEIAAFQAARKGGE